MHEIYDCDKHVYVPTIYEPVRKTDRVFVLRDGIIYEWNNTVTEQIAEDDLRHFNETNFVLTENKVSVDDILAEIAEGVKYESNDTNPDKTESFLLKKLCDDKRFHNANVPELDDSQFCISDLKPIASMIISLAYRGELCPEANEIMKKGGQSESDVQAYMWLGKKDKNMNKLLTAWFAVRKLCEKLKADKEAEQAAKVATNPVVPSVTPAEADKS